MILKSFAQLGGCDHTLHTHSVYGPDFIVYINRNSPYGQTTKAFSNKGYLFIDQKFIDQNPINMVCHLNLRKIFVYRQPIIQWFSSFNPGL